MITIKDINNIPEVLNKLNALKPIKVGILSGGKMLTIGTVHEFGATIKVTPRMRAFLHSEGLHLKKGTKEINIPERSFIRAGFDENEQKITDKIESLILNVLDKKISTSAFLNFVGEYSAGVFQNYMTDLKEPPLTSFTVLKKGSTNPLIDTGHLRDSITFKILE